MANNLLSLRTGLRQRRPGTVFLMVAVFTSAISLLNGPVLTQWLHDYRAVGEHFFQLTGIGFLLAGLGVFAFEPSIRRVLEDGKATALLAWFMMAISAGVVTLTVPLQEYRNMNYPGPLWFFTIGVLTLCALTIAFISLNPAHKPTLPLIRWGMLLTTAYSLILIVMHLSSVGHFMRLDMPDEPILASAATSYALTGNLTSAFDGGIYGSPDPSVARYYWLMAMWLKVADQTDFVTLRTFPLIVAGVTVLITGISLWKARELNSLQKLIAIVTLLGFSPFIRASHSLRPDIGFALYGSIVLASMVLYQHKMIRNPIWLFVMGASLYLGLETIPSYALPFGTSVGLIVVVLSINLEKHEVRWAGILAYALGCIVAGLAFLLIHFLPDFAANWDHFRTFLQVYMGDNQGRALGANIFGGIAYFGRFNMVISPVEIIIILGPTLWLLWRGTTLDRTVASLSLAALVTMFFPWAGGYTYFALAGPFVAYTAARVCRNEYLTMLALFVVAPAMVAAPVFDLYTETALGENHLMLEEASQIIWQIPEDTTILGDDQFWYILHDQGREFIGWHGVQSLEQILDLSREQVLNELDIDIVICEEANSRCTALAQYSIFAEPTDFTITRGNFLIYRRR